MAHILVIDDDADILRLIQRILSSAGHDVTTVQNATRMTGQKLSQFELILLDVSMPEVDGFSFLRSNRSLIDAPVIFLTARDFERDMLEGFASGGDDYVTKPFSRQALLARVDAHLRREDRQKTIRLISGRIMCDLLSKTFYVDDAPLVLTHSEYQICEFLLKHRNQIFSKEHLYTSVYGYDAEGDSKTTVTERIKKIRQKFAEFNINPIKTVWGVGYQWQNNPSEGY